MTWSWWYNINTSLGDCSTAARLVTLAPCVWWCTCVVRRRDQDTYHSETRRCVSGHRSCWPYKHLLIRYQLSVPTHTPHHQHLSYNIKINISTIISRSTISSYHGSQVGHSGVWHKQYQCCWRGEIEVFVACSLAAWQTVAAGDHIGGYSLHQDAANTTQICSRVLTKINATFSSSLNIFI